MIPSAKEKVLTLATKLLNNTEYHNCFFFFWEGNDSRLY